MVADLAKHLRWAREIVEPNQAECARIMEVEQSTWNKWEAGTRVPDAFKMVEFANRFRVTLDYLYLGKLTGVDEDLKDLLIAYHPELVLGRADKVTGTDKAPLLHRRSKAKADV